jgi:hypothetical protein
LERFTNLPELAENTHSWHSTPTEFVVVQVEIEMEVQGEVQG